MYLMSYCGLDGQKIAKKLSVQISKETNSLKSLLLEYNACISADSTISVAEALDPPTIEEKLRELGYSCNRREEADH